MYMASSNVNNIPSADETHSMGIMIQNKRYNLVGRSKHQQNTMSGKHTLRPPD
jgi:hypothetical protein